VLHVRFAQEYPLCVLVVEDQPTNLKLILRVLEKLGYDKVPFATDGLQAVEATKGQHFDLILMDMQMPHMDGTAATRAIRELYRTQFCESRPQQPTILAMTSNAMESDKDKCISAGMDDFLTKPLNISLLMEKLQFWQITKCKSIASLHSPC